MQIIVTALAVIGGCIMALALIAFLSDLVWEVKRERRIRRNAR